MENHIFLSPAVAGRMQQLVVEARLHTDIQNTLTAEQLAANRELQERIAGTKANPYYVVIDPKTGQKLGEHALSGGPGAWEQGWVDFLDAVAKAAGR